MKKTIITLCLCLFFTGCGSAKFMQWLDSTGDAFTNGVELGKRVKSIMFECDFKDKCFYEELDLLLEEECKNYQAYDLVNERECLVVNKKLFEKIYEHNKKYLGY